MHLLGREMKVTAILPDGTTKPMIWIKDWDFNWQGQYLYEKPMTLPKGTKLEMVAYYDNSTANLRNPNTPPKRVTWGEQTTDEMALCFVQLVVKDEAEARQLRGGDDSATDQQWNTCSAETIGISVPVLSPAFRRLFSS